jgi:hypothetical protein
MCRECSREKCRGWYARNREYASQREKVRKKQYPEQYRERRKIYRSRVETRAKEMLSSSKWSSRKKGIDFDLDAEWIAAKLTAGTCELTGLMFRLEPLDGGRQNPYTASLDRIDSSKGYVKSNVRMILWALNAAFNSYGEGIYAEIARVYLARHGGLT